MTATVFLRPSSTTQRSDWLRSASAGISAMQSMKLSVESMNVVLRHCSLGIQTMRAAVDDCIEAGKLIDAGHAEAAKATLRSILHRIGETADMYEALQKEVLTAEQQSALAVNQLADWLKSTLP